MEKYTQITREAYDALAEEYRKRVSCKSLFEERVEILAGHTLRWAKERFDHVNALEIGPGSGEACAYLHSHGCRTTAIDISQRMLDVVRDVSPSTTLINADILEHNLPQNEYELVYCGAVIHLFTKMDAAGILPKIRHSLKPGGVLFISTTIHAESSEGFYVKSDYPPPVKRFRHNYTEQEFRQLVEQGDFKVLERIFTDEQDRSKQWVGYICES